MSVTHNYLSPRVYTLNISPDRVPYLVQQLGDKINILGEDQGLIKVSITISSDIDVLYVFHAGTRVGMNGL